MKNLIQKVVTITLTALPLVGLAQFIPNPNVPQSGVKNLDDISRILVNLVNWVTGIFFVAAVLFMFYSAYLYLGAAGNPERFTKAKEQTIYAILAVIVALLAGSVRFIVESILR